MVKLSLFLFAYWFRWCFSCASYKRLSGFLIRQSHRGLHEGTYANGSTWISRFPGFLGSWVVLILCRYGCKYYNTILFTNLHKTCGVSTGISKLSRNLRKISHVCCLQLKVLIHSISIVFTLNIEL